MYLCFAIFLFLNFSFILKSSNIDISKAKFVLLSFILIGGKTIEILNFTKKNNFCSTRDYYSLNLYYVWGYPHMISYFFKKYFCSLFYLSQHLTIPRLSHVTLCYIKIYLLFRNNPLRYKSCFKFHFLILAMCFNDNCE